MTLPNCYRCHHHPCDCDHSLYDGDCLQIMQGMAADSVDLVFGSPPYMDARTYGIDAQRDCLAWVTWMLEVSEAAARICRGPVVWVVGGVTRDRCYWPGPEGLAWQWWQRGGTHQLYRPCYYHRVGIPGSGGKDWFRADVEYVLCLKRPGALPWSDNTAMGHPPKWAPGGEMSHRLTDGTRTNQWGKTGQDTASGVKVSPTGHVRSKGSRPSHRYVHNRVANGRRAKAGMHGQDTPYSEPVLANPGNLIHLNVGGGVMGSKLAHENEAPFPEKLAEWFILSCCPPGGLVLDPFVGSGTTSAVAQRSGRRSIGIDVRQSQCEVAARRLEQEVLF